MSPAEDCPSAPGAAGPPFISRPPAPRAQGPSPPHGRAANPCTGVPQTARTGVPQDSRRPRAEARSGLWGCCRRRWRIRIALWAEVLGPFGSVNLQAAHLRKRPGGGVIGLDVRYLSHDRG